MLAHRRRVDRSCPRVRVITAAAPARVRTGDLQFVKRGARPLEQGVQRARGDFSIIAERGRQYTVDLGRGRGGERRLEPEQRIPAWWVSEDGEGVRRCGLWVGGMRDDGCIGGDVTDLFVPT